MPCGKDTDYGIDRITAGVCRRAAADAFVPAPQPVSCLLYTSIDLEQIYTLSRFAVNYYAGENGGVYYPLDVKVYICLLYTSRCV